MITIDVDMDGLNEKISRIESLAHKIPGSTVKSEARLLCVELVKYTQPFGEDGEDKKKGEGALRRDYSRVYPDVKSEFIGDQIKAKARPRDKESAKQRWLKYARGGNEEAMRNMLQDMKIGATAYGVKADPSFHKSRWSRGTLKRGSSQIVTDRKSVDSLIKDALKMVGFVKRGWSTCAKLLGGTRGIPGWISRGSGAGRVIDKTNQKNPSITIINDSTYTSQVLSQSGKQHAIKDREIKLGIKIDNALKYEICKL